MNVLALCSGIGGLELGIDRATGGAARVVCYVEREAYAASVLVARMESGELAPAPIWSDLDTFDAEPWGGIADCVTAGFPCQPFSAAGKGLGLEDERWLWPRIANIVETVAPAIAFFENVPGLERHGLEVVWGDLRRLGYDVAAGTFTACEVGAPHIRKRLFVLAYADGRAGDASHPTNQSDIKWSAARPEQLDGCGALAADANGSRQSQPQGGVTDIRRWSRDSGGWPALSAVCRVDDGCADRLDRLRALGNGVVPAQAALAWRELWGRLS